MKRRLVRLLAAFCCVIAIAYGALFVVTPPPAWAPVCLAIGANGVMMSLMAIGAMRRDTIPRSLAYTFVILFALCAGSFVAALLMPPHEGVGGTLLLGLPLRTAIVVYAVGVVPIFVLPFAYALTFDSSTLNEDDLARVREAFTQMRAAGDRA